MEETKFNINARFGHFSLLLLLWLGIVSFFLVFGFDNLSTPDPYDYAQMARNLVEGSGFTTDVLTPISWSKVPVLDDHPDLWRAPFYPLLVALGFALVGPHEIVLPLVSAISFFGVVVLTYRITERLFDRSSAFYASLFVLTAPGLLRTGITGYTESTYLFLVLLSIWVVTGDSRRPYLLGLVSGLAYLTRYNHWFFLAGILYFALRKLDRDRFLYAVQFTGVFLLVLSPWLVRNAVWTGNPFYQHHAYLLASHNSINKGFEVFFQFDPASPIGFVLEHPVVLLKKSMTNLVKLYQWVPRFFRETWLLVLVAAPGLLSRETRDDFFRRGVLTVFGIGFVLQAIGLSFVHIKARHFIPFTLVIFIFAGGSLERLIGPRQWFNGSVLAGILVVINLAFVVTMNPWGVSVTAQEYRALDEHVPEGEPILTNVPELTAWYADRPSLWMVSLRKSERHYPNFRYIFISPEVLREYPETLNLQRDYLRNESFRKKFKLKKEFPESRSRLYVRRSKL
jgi:4-amino-4-deoxy-L-arabinose transferase-like glycosyltransferase